MTDAIRLRVKPALIPSNAEVEVGTVTTLAPGAPATVVNSGTPSAVVLDFGIPAGETGATGANGLDGTNGLDGADGVVQAIVAGTNITVDATDPANPIISSSGGSYTDEQAQDAVGSILVDSSEIDFTYSDATPSITASIVAGSIDEAKLDASVNASLDLADTSVQPNTSPTLTSINVGNADTTIARVSAGVISVEGVTVLTTATGQPLDADLTSWAGVTRAAGFDTFAATPSSANLRSLLSDEVGTGAAYFVGGALGTPASATLTNATGLPVAGITSSTSTALGVGSLELGHASDTTLTRSAAGRLAVEGADVLLASVADQTITGGARVTTLDLGNLSGASITPDPGDRSIQKVTNNGAGSILPGSNEGQYTLQVINTTGAGAITTTGWLLEGDSFDTTTTSKFLCSCFVTSDIKCMSILKVV
jgi:hypothetical protein